MRKALIVLMLPLVMVMAAEKKKPLADARGSETSVVKHTIPADAKEISPDVFRHTDKQGKTWLYRKTPFGVNRVEEKAATPAAADDPSLVIKAKDLGDSVQFERPTPFGVSRWERKKSELTDVERTAWERSQKESTPAPDPAK